VVLLLWAMANKDGSLLPKRVLVSPNPAPHQPTLTGSFVQLTEKKIKDMDRAGKYNYFQDWWFARNRGKYATNKARGPARHGVPSRILGASVGLPVLHAI